MAEARNALDRGQLRCYQSPVRTLAVAECIFSEQLLSYTMN